jgi:hypothetical protein
MKRKKWVFLFFIGILAGCLVLSGCGKKGTRDNTPQVLTPAADGTTTYESASAVIDASHSDQCYVMVHYTGSSDKVKLQITVPSGTVYTYNLGTDWAAFPLTGDSGDYTLTVLEHAYDNQYTTAFSQTVAVTIANAFGPYLYPSQYVNFNASSKAVAKGKDLAANADSDLDVVKNVYDYGTKNITYDSSEAATVTSDYLPNVDEILDSGKGICFDYTALMAAMLRSQNIPTRLEVGYAGSLYHAWISVYTDESGWINGVIQFDGKAWTLMDPTLGANNGNESVKEYIGDGSNYQTKYVY